MDRLPDLPVEDEVRLREPWLRESFLTRVFVYHRWSELASDGIDPSALVRFNREIRFLVMARSGARTDINVIACVLSEVEGTETRVLGQRYIRALMDALKRPADRTSHSKVLRRILDELAPDLGEGEATRLAAKIDALRGGKVPWVVPAAALRHYLANHPGHDTAYQLYLQPFPEELSLPDAC
jgi:uncharacterized protein YbgA (DUF1722 family)